MVIINNVKSHITLTSLAGTCACETYHVDPVNCAQFETLILGIQNNINHGTHFRRYDVVRRTERRTLLQPLLESRLGFLDRSLEHVAGHELESLLQMDPELLVGPVETADEGLQSVQLPKEVLRGGAPVAFDLPALFLEALVHRLVDRGLHEVHVPHHQRSEGVSQQLMEPPVSQVI